jgi:hypothetical protein
MQLTALSLALTVPRARLPYIFSPASLFTGGAEGVLLEAFDIDTLFQDAAGAPPVTAARQPVGLMLDKSQGLVLGPELVTNGTFDTNLTGWTAFGGLSSQVRDTTIFPSGGMLITSRGGISTHTTQTLTGLVIGRRYQITCQAYTPSTNPGTDAATIGTQAVAFTLQGSTQKTGRNVVQDLSIVFVATASSQTIYLSVVSSDFNAWGTNGSVAYFDNISVREIPGNHATQSTAAARPTYRTSPARMTLDKVDDRLSVTVPTGGFTGTVVLATDQGTASYGVNIPAGPYEIGGKSGLYFPGDAIVGQLIRNGALSKGEAAATEAYFVGNGATASYGAVTNFNAFWRNRSEITSFPLIDTSSGTNFQYAWQICSSLTSFPLIDTSAGTNFTQAWQTCSRLTSFPLIDTSSGTNFQYAWFGCSSLTSFPLIDTSSGTNFQYAWYGCSSLTSFPLIDTSSGTTFAAAWYGCSSLTSFPLIDTSSGTTFAAAWQTCSRLTSFPLIDTSAGTTFTQAWFGCSRLTSFPANIFDNIKAGDFTNAFANTALTQTSIDNILVSLVASGIAAGTRQFDQSGGSAPSVTGESAITTLRARGWTVSVTGGF